MERPALADRCRPTRRRLTLLQAPGGFGKTTLLAECCRALAASGVPNAWLTLHEGGGAMLDAYLAFALERAGLTSGAPPAPHGGAWSDDGHLPAALASVAAEGRPWVVALDELERLTDPDSVAVIARLLRDAPPNLHLALSCRELPPALDISAALSNGAEVLTVDELRFTRAEIERFFGGELPAPELTEVVERSAGWPVAVRVSRNVTRQPDAGREGVVRGVVENWLEARLWDGLADVDREFLLDAGLLEWIDAELLDEALDGTGLLPQLERMPCLAGLLEAPAGGAATLRMHPLVREHCIRSRRRYAPARYATVHRRIAAVLERRGDVVSAMRHAAEAGDPELVGRIFVTAGGVRLALREGTVRLVAAAAFVDEEVLARHPRLGYACVYAHVVNGRIAEAARQLAATDAAVADGGADVDLAGERFSADGLLAQIRCTLSGPEAYRQRHAVHRRMAAQQGQDPLVRASAEYGRCQMYNYRADFDAALRSAAAANRWLRNQSAYLAMAIDYQYGEVAMVQGRIRDAEARYARALRTLRRSFVKDLRLAALGRLLTQELDLERDRLAVELAPARAPGDIRAGGATLASQAAAAAVVVELAQQLRGADAALDLLEQMWEAARRNAMPALVRLLAGLRVDVLTVAGRVGEAELRWRADELPATLDGCMDLTGQSWREMEVMVFGRHRLLAARGDAAEARRLVRAAGALATKRGLRRTEMRLLARGMAAEHALGRSAAAVDCLVRFLGLFRASDYARPLVREGTAALATLATVAADGADPALRDSAETLITWMRDRDSRVNLTPRERQVLLLMDGRKDREIAEQLGLSVYGVRHHVRRLFGKLRVRDRHAAIEAARRRGLLPPAG